jgi:DNA-binding transcriptional LysR family regulator
MNILDTTTKQSPNATLPLLELDILRTFVAIAETKSFGQAAEIVHRTPSAVSMQIRKLEEILGRSLFQRNARSVTLTLDGEMLLPEARTMLAMNREIVSKFIIPEIAGTVVLGGTDDFIEYFLPKVLERFSNSHPNIVVDVVVDHSTELAKRFAKGELDIAVVNSLEHKPLIPNSESIYKSQVVWVGLCGGQAHLKRPLPISMWDHGCPWSECAIEGLSKEGIDYRTAFVSGHVAGQKAAVRTDLAIAPMAPILVEEDMVVLPPETGLPSLNSFSVDLAIKDDADCAALAVKKHIIDVWDLM